MLSATDKIQKPTRLREVKGTSPSQVITPVAAPPSPPQALQQLRELAVAYSSILFLNNPVLGVALLLSTFVVPDVACCGLIGLTSSWVIMRLLSIRIAAFRAFVLYNCLLTGLFVGYIFKLDAKVALLAIVASALCLMLTAAADSVLHFYELPVLSLPFTTTAVLLALARPQLSNLADSSPYHVGHLLPLSDSINAALKCMGSIFCTPDPLFGAIALALLLIASPLTGLFFVGGFFLGHEIEGLLRLGDPQAYVMHQFNYSLTFTAISLVFLQPSRKSILLGLLTVPLTLIVALGSSTFWSGYHIPMVPFAFNVTVLILLRATRWTLPGWVRSTYAGSPEATLDNSRLFRLRQRSGEVGIFCPFDGSWVVQQGFDGPWTHRGNWRHALDFVKQGEDGKTFFNRGFDLSDHYCFAQPVLAPLDGVVVATCSDQPDNPIGSVDNQNNWGNYVMVRASAGYHVLLAHLKQDSVTVKPGETVQVGRPLALCGNSGYSQEPHLHVQVQWYATLGAHTVPFHLLNFQIKDQLNFRGLPTVGGEVRSFSGNVALGRALSFRIGETLKFRGGTASARETEVRVDLDEVSGATYLTDGKNSLSFGKLGSALFFYGFKGSTDSFLSDLFRAAPRIPLVFGEPSRFSDVLPIGFHHSRVASVDRGMVLMQELLDLPGRSLTRDYLFNPRDLEIRGVDSFLKLDPFQGLTQLEVQGRKYARVT
jgi:murein DD-endopeptidase MepM/ murein hydrolase activator NlpD/urea transporter